MESRGGLHSYGGFLMPFLGPRYCVFYRLKGAGGR